MTDYELPVWAETTMQIFAIVTLIASIIAVLILLAWMFHSSIETDKERKEYIRSLNEHDKAVIAEYNAIQKLARWRKGKKQ